jgi:hypothetical protein
VIDEHLSVMALPLATSLQASGIDYLARAGAGLLQRVGKPRTTGLSMPVLDTASDDGRPGCAFESDEASATV